MPRVKEHLKEPVFFIFQVRATYFVMIILNLLHFGMSDIASNCISLHCIVKNCIAYKCISRQTQTSIIQVDLDRPQLLQEILLPSEFGWVDPTLFYCIAQILSHELELVLLRSTYLKVL